MENTYEFDLSAKDYGRIMRWQRRWGLLLVFILIGLEFGCGLISGLAYIFKWPVGLYPLIGILPLSILGFFAFLRTYQNGGAQIYGKCSLSFTEDGRLKARCERPVYTNRDAERGKTLTPKGIVEYKGFYIVLGEKGDWVALPGDAPIDQIRELIK